MPLLRLDTIERLFAVFFWFLDIIRMGHQRGSQSRICSSPKPCPCEFEPNKSARKWNGGKEIVGTAHLR